MSETSFIYPVQEVLGAVARKGTIHRKKSFRSPSGKFIGDGKVESYMITKPRNYKKKPAIGRELQNLMLNKQAWKQAAQELKDPQSERYLYWVKRFDAQIVCGEGDAPIDKKTGKPKIYRDFRAFVRTAIRRQILQESSQPLA